MNKYLKISRASYVITFILIPIAVSPFSLTPYTLVKILLLSFGVFVSLFFYLLSKPESVKIPSKIYLLLLITEIPNWILNKEFSYFPRYSEGFLISFLVFLFVFLGINLFKKIDYEKILVYSSIPLILICLIDLTNTYVRASGTLGQANFLGIFIVLVLLSIINRYKEFPEKTQKYLLIYFVILGILFFKAASITSLVSLIAGLIILRKKIFVKAKHIFLIVLLSYCLLFVFGEIYISKIQDIYNQLFFPKQTIISDSFLIRKAIWNESINLIIENPSKIILGFGPNSFDYYFEKLREYKLDNYSEKYLLFDKPHNYYLELIFSYGAIYFLILTFAIFRVLKNYKEYRFLLIPILVFLFFNWLDIYLKVLFFSLIFCNLNNFESKRYFIGIPLLIFSFIIFCLFLNLFYKDTSFYLGNSNYIFSNSKEDLINLKYKNPILLLESLKFIEQKKEIRNFLINEFKGNQAILFQLN